MTLTIRILDPDTEHVLVDMPGIKSKLVFGTNETSQFDAEVAANFPGSELLENGLLIEIYFEGELLLTGTIQDKSDSQGETIQLNGRALLDKLYTEKSWFYSYYEDTPVHAILSELLITAGWRLGDVDTMEDPDALTTLDLRSERNLLTQINKLLEGDSGSFYREGDEILGYPTLDVGEFQRTSGLLATQHPDFTTNKRDNPTTFWITKLTFITQSGDAFYGVRPEGGKVNEGGIDTIVTLRQTFQDDPSQAFDPDFPIIEELKDTSYILLNLRDFDNPGGEVISTTVINSILPLGDFSGAPAPVDDRWGMITFLPIPGILDYVTVQIGSTTGSGWFAEWFIVEVDTDYRTILEILYVHETLVPADDLDESLYRFIPNEDILLEKGKLYGIVMGIDNILTTQLFQIDIRNVVETDSHFRLNYFNSKPVVSDTAVNYQREVKAVVKTRPLQSRVESLVTEKAPKYTPPKTGSAAAASEILANSQTLKLWGRAFLEDHGPDVVRYNMSAELTKNLPKPGETIFVDSQATQQYYDRLRGQLIQGSVSRVQKNLRIDKMSVDISGDSIRGDFELSEGNAGRAVAQFVELYDEASDRDTPEGGLPEPIWQLLDDPIGLAVSAAVPNTTNTYGYLAYQTQINIYDGLYSSVPTGVEQVYLSGIPTGDLNDENFVVELVQLPDLYLPITDVIVKVGFRNRNWTFDDSVNLTFRLLWR